MREIRDGGKISGADRIAVMAALNSPTNCCANAARRRRAATAARSSSAGVDGPDARRRIMAMQAAIDQTMAGQEKLL